MLSYLHCREGVPHMSKRSQHAHICVPIWHDVLCSHLLKGPQCTVRLLTVRKTVYYMAICNHVRLDARAGCTHQFKNAFGLAKVVRAAVVLQQLVVHGGPGFDSQ